MSFYRGPQSPRDESLPSNPLSPPQQRNPNRWSANAATTTDVRGALHRRFTTNTVPTLSPIGQQRRQAAGDMQQTLGAMNRMSLGERKQRRYEELLDIQRRIQQELDQVDDETRREAGENRRREQMVTQLFAQSEPTTPPEYHNSFASTFSRPNRNSVASFTSPPGIATRPNRSSTQLTSPSSGFARTYNIGNSVALPSQSVPGSRRQSDDEDDDSFHYGIDLGAHRSAANPNRNSMPITTLDRKRNTTDLSFGLVNTTSFLFDDDDDDKHTSRQVKSNKTSPPDTKTFLQVQHTADGFPKLIRREDNGDLSVSAALDLASASDTQLPDRAPGTRHRISLPPSGLGGSMSIAPLNSILANATDNRPTTNTRRSMEVKFSADTKRSSLLASPPRSFANGPQMTSSYSTNDIPTLKSMKGDTTSEGAHPVVSQAAQSVNATHPTSPDQAPGVLAHLTSSSARQSQDFTNHTKSEENSEVSQPSSGLQANAAPFGPFSPDQVHSQGFNVPNLNSYVPPTSFYNHLGMHMMNNGFPSNMGINGGNGYAAPAPWPAQAPNMYANAGYGGYQQFSQANQRGQAGPGAGRFDDARSVQQRRQQDEAAQSRFNSINIHELAGEIYNLCKDQHGCRFLQRKLEERNEATVKIIFDEVHTHMVDLMVDPFGNYLCQKLLESANDGQRLMLVENAAPAMTTIALNQHGTRALQKMIECIKTPEETVVIIEALRNDVVPLIQDLNGNHVIQKCLNHLSSPDAHFIFDAVGNNCVIVGTHRHGCCVLQRCIDHADGLQKGEMVDHVIRNAFSLVQDPFGNYVVQYILDLGEPSFTEPLCKAFLGEIFALSKQKFSSNVIEKCIRVAQEDTRREIVLEIMVPGTLDKLLRDGFANYVVQTAMDFAPGETKVALMDAIRGYVPGIRNTPHGRRIGSKLTDFDSRNQVPAAAALSPLESITSPNVTTKHVAHNAPAPSRANRHGMIGVPLQWSNGGNFTNGGAFDTAQYGAYNGNNIAAPVPQRGNHNFHTFAQGFNPNGSDTTSSFTSPNSSEAYVYGNGQAYVNGTNQF